MCRLGNKRAAIKAGSVTSGRSSFHEKRAVTMWRNESDECLKDKWSLHRWFVRETRLVCANEDFQRKRHSPPAWPDICNGQPSPSHLGFRWSSVFGKLKLCSSRMPKQEMTIGFIAHPDAEMYIAAIRVHVLVVQIWCLAPTAYLCRLVHVSGCCQQYEHVF